MHGNRQTQKHSTNLSDLINFQQNPSRPDSTSTKRITELPSLCKCGAVDWPAAFWSVDTAYLMVMADQPILTHPDRSVQTSLSNGAM